MKRFLLILFIVPQLTFSQYRANCFSLATDTGFHSKRMGCSVCSDTIIDLSIANGISGFSLSGHSTLGNNQDSYIRVLLVDDSYYEHMVYESYPLLVEERGETFSNIGIETVALENVSPRQLRIEVKDAILQMDSLNYRLSEKGQSDVINAGEVQLQQARLIADRLNANLKQHNMTWRAGITPLSTMTFEEKKDMFGGEVPQLYGLEYYKSGVFVVPGNSITGRQSLLSARNNNYVKEWDWRNRHGKNWMTSAKDQGACGSCWIFSAVGALEAYINLYFNRNLEYDLSEQEIVSCYGYGCNSGLPQNALRKIRDHGIVTEECFEYVANAVPCNKCASPQDVVSISNYDSLYRDYGIINVLEEDMKRELFRCPIITGPTSWGHSMVLTGFKTLEHGDVLRLASYTDSVVVDSILHHDMIGRTAWLMKSSWGTEWGENGYGYVIDNNGFYTNPWRIKGSVFSTLYNDNDIVCEDRDGDGYYFWGIGAKPTSCPSWVPDDPDGDDSSPLYGPIDEYGNLQENQFLDITIDSYVVSTGEHLPVHYRYHVVNGGTLVITGTTNLHYLGSISVDSGGVLIVDGGIIENAELDLASGSKLIVRNNGKIVKKSGLLFSAPVGVLVDIESGIIE